MVDYQRIRRQQALREAEGYLELIMVFEDQWPVDSGLRARIAQRALSTLKRVPSLASHRIEVLYLEGQAYRAMHRCREALVPLESAIELDPENTVIWLALAWCYKRNGRLDLAIQSLENALAVDPGQAILHFNLACYWSLAGNTDLALKYLAQSLEIDPEYRELMASERDFDPIRDLPNFQALMSVVV